MLIGECAFAGLLVCQEWENQLATKKQLRTCCVYVCTRYDVPVKAGQMSANCSFLPDPSMVFETQEKCVGRFHVKNHLLSGHVVTEEFAVLEEFRIHQVLLPFEVG